jgi:hypothetical protein
VRSKSLPIGKQRDLPVARPACGFEILCQVLVVLLAAGFEAYCCSASASICWTVSLLRCQ